MRTIRLSENAVAVLRFEVKGYRMKNKTASRSEAYRELSAAGIMEPVPGAEDEFRFTEEGKRDGEEIARRETDRIELERYEPPDASDLSADAIQLLRVCADGKRLEGDESNRPAYRELVKARIMIPLGTFARGDECAFRFTPLGWRDRFEILEQVTG